MQKTQDDFSGKENNFKKMIKNKFILSVIVIIIGIIGLGVYSSSTNADDRNSYILLVEGNASLNDVNLIINSKELLHVGDSIKTIGNNSLAILEWGDGSVTRLGGNTTIKIKNLYLTKNLSKINIAFELVNGKSWSTVISFLGEDSYFREEFRDTVAAVRGTVFDVDLENNYLYVIDHKVNVTNKDGDTILVEQNKPLNLLTFDFISLEEFLKGFKDKAWEKLNTRIDKELLQGLQDQIHKNLDQLVNIKDLDIEGVISEEDKQKLYNKIIEDYQKLNFIKPDNKELFKKKIELKEALIKLSSNENKTMLIQNTFYDFKNIIKSKNYEELDILLPILGDNKDLLNNLNFNKVINFNALPDDIKAKFENLKILIIDVSRDIDLKIKDTLDSGINLLNK